MTPLKRDTSSKLFKRELQEISLGLENLGMGLMEVSHIIRYSGTDYYMNEEMKRLLHIHSLLDFYGKKLRKLNGQFKPEEFRHDQD